MSTAPKKSHDEEISSPAMVHDASFLAKCEQFLLHPTVRALSLAQRVDFLENKGLSPEEITACLKNVERQNGLSRLLGGAAGAVSASDAVSLGSAASSPLWMLVKGYGLATAATLLLAYGYVRLRQRMIVQLVMMQRQAAAKRRQTRQLSVVEAMRLVADQRRQYEQVGSGALPVVAGYSKVSRTGSSVGVDASEKPHNAAAVARVHGRWKRHCDG
jgi:hypothetical protein